MEQDKDDMNQKEIVIDDISPKTREKAIELYEKIMKFKRLLFNTIVTNDKNYSPEDLKPLEIYCQMFFQAIQYWIQKARNQEGQMEPLFENSTTIINNFKSLTKQIQQYSNYDSDAPTLMYSILLKFSTQHPYTFNLESK
jgi:hypothetical protein